MSSTVFVLVPHGALPADGYVSQGCEVIEWHVPDDIVRVLGGLAAEVTGVVLMTDGLPETALTSVIQSVQACGIPVVEVRGSQWDGLTPAPLAAACKGFISGFGIEGAWAAAEALRSR